MKVWCSSSQLRIFTRIAYVYVSSYQLCETFQSADSGLLFSSDELSSICVLIAGSPPSVPFSSRTSNIVHLDHPRSDLRVFHLFPHEFSLIIFLLSTWRQTVFLFGLPGHYSHLNRDSPTVLGKTLF